MSKKIVFVFFSIILVSIILSGYAFAKERTALIIGNADYQSAPLDNPVNDARDMAAKLKEIGFKVIKRMNADEESMVAAIDKFYKRLRDSRVGLFYYAGHGMQIQGTNYLIPVGAHITSQSDVEFESVQAGRILGKMKDANNKLNIVILDACRNNPFERSFRNVDKGLAKMQAPTGSLVAYATAPGSVAAEGSGENGIYTKYLLKHMDHVGWSIRKVLLETRKDVYQATGEKQVPWSSSSLMGNFYFVHGDKASSVEPSEGEKEQSHSDRIKPSISEGTTHVTGGRAILHVQSKPSQARIYIDGQELGKTPFSRDDLVPGKHRMKVGKSHFQPKTQEINLAANMVKKYSVDLKKGKGSLTVLSTPSGAEVFVDGDKKSGKTPMTLKEVKCGKHTVKTRFQKKDEKIEIKKEITIPREQTKRFKVDLQKNTANLTVHTDPSTAKVNIVNKELKYHDGVELLPGRCRIYVYRQGYKGIVKDIKLASNQDKEIQVSLKKQKNIEAGYTWTEPVTGMEFVWVPGGCYQMGSPLKGKSTISSQQKKSAWYKAFAALSCLFPVGCAPKSFEQRHGHEKDETPAHKVCVDGFWIGKYEVTIDQYREFMQVNGHTEKLEFELQNFEGEFFPLKHLYGSYPLSGNKFGKNGDQPMIYINYQRAKAFADWLSRKTGMEFRLPTEAEWEYAARSGGKRQKYAGGDDLDSVARYDHNTGYHTYEVGTKSPNGLGIYDMSGNVWEWCSDWYSEDYYSNSPKNNPQGPSSGSDRVIRGGSWDTFATHVRTTNRSFNIPSDVEIDVGLRLVRTAE